MNIQNNTPFLTFQGYDARPLKALCMTTVRGGIADELAKIGKKVGFDVYVANDEFLKKVPLKSKKIIFQTFRNWAQDMAVISPNKEVIGRSEDFRYREVLKEFLRKDSSMIISAPPGGNIFYLKDFDNKEILLVGSNNKHIGEDPVSFKELYGRSFEDTYGIKKFDFVPQMDFHIDLFLRPLDKKRILVADDSLTIKALENSIEKLNEAIKNTNLNLIKKMHLMYSKMHLKAQLRMFKNNVSTNRRAQVDLVTSQLEGNGYSVYRVPGRLYSLYASDKDLVHTVTKDKKGDLVYITNKSKLDTDCHLDNKYVKGLDLGIEKAFVKSLSPFIKEENIYFVSGENYAVSELLTRYYGGIHCLVTEIPK